MAINSIHPDYKAHLHRWELVNSIVDSQAERFIRNVDVNDDKHEEWCEDNDKESWETCPECKEDCESICEVIYNN